MARVLGVDHPFLKRLALNSLYNHLSSLRPLRIYLTREKKLNRRGCRGCSRRTVVSVPKDVFEKVVSDRKFADDMEKLKKMHNADKLIIKVANLRTTW